MIYPECSDCSECFECPYRLDLPDHLSDAAVAHLVDLLYALASAIENRCYHQLRRYHADQRNQHHEHQSSPPHPPDTPDDDLPF